MSWRRDRSDPGAMRAKLVGLGLAALFAIIAMRGGALSVGGEDARLANGGVFQDSPPRAEIVDRNGELLATSVAAYSLFADPRAVWDPVSTTDALARLFPDLDRDLIHARLADRERAFVWIKRGLTPRQRQAVFDMGLEGLGFRLESRRAYPRGALAGHVLGYANVDGKGLAGVEFAMDDRLRGGGAPLRLTIDTGAQFALEAELSAAAGRYDVEGAAGVVLEAQTGAVRALASWPPVDPNIWTGADDHARLDRAVGAVYELGSVFKPFTIANGFDAGVVTPGERFDLTAPVVVAGKAFEDHHRVTSSESLANIVADSSNKGAVLVGLRVGVRRQQEFLQALGLLDRAPVELAASAAPLLPREWTELTLATASFGHGLSVTPIAFASAFSAFANDGEVTPPTLIERSIGDRSSARRVMSAPTAATVTALLRETVRRGTGEQADVAGYRVAGKTGTAEKPVGGAYDADRNVTSFSAIFPADDPKYVVLIVLDEPKPVDGGGSTAAFNAAPTAGRVIERIAPLLGIAPDFDTEDPALRTAADRRAL